MSILLNAQLLLFSFTLPQAKIIATRHVRDHVRDNFTLVLFCFVSGF